MTDTIELFPGVKFRKDTTKPLGNQWLFEHDGHWLIAKLAYSDDLTLDHVAKVTQERDKLRADVERLTEEYDKAWRHDLNDKNNYQALTAEVTRLSAEVSNMLPDVARYRWMRDCPWVGHIQQVGIMSADDDTKWLSGADADRAIDAAMAPPAPETVVITLPVKPIPDADRKCNAPDCWYCDGTGRDPVNGWACTMNGQIPF